MLCPRAISNHVTFQPTSLKLHGASGHQLEVLGEFQATIQHRKESLQQELYMLNDMEGSLLGRKVSIQLELIQLLCIASDHVTKEYCEQYPELCLREMAGEYKIKLSKCAMLVFLQARQRVPWCL